MTTFDWALSMAPLSSPMALLDSKLLAVTIMAIAATTIPIKIHIHFTPKSL
jgi:hypothetical protein